MPTGFSLSGSGLKWLAMLTMLLDHIGAVLLKPYLADPAAAAVYPVLRRIGRMSFPIYCFLLTEGVRHTAHPRRYALRRSSCVYRDFCAAKTAVLLLGRVFVLERIRQICQILRAVL